MIILLSLSMFVVILLRWVKITTEFQNSLLWTVLSFLLCVFNFIETSMSGVTIFYGCLTIFWIICVYADRDGEF